MNKLSFILISLLLTQISTGPDFAEVKLIIWLESY